VLRAGPNIDHAAAHLRRPPAGYGWFSLNGAFVLASLSTGLVVEVVRP
jgi:Ni/Co efflux regulator RcnB